MEYIICIILLILTVILYKLIFKINTKKIRALEKNEELTEIADKFPDNIEIAEEMLDMLGNKNVKIKQSQNAKTSLYIAIANEITIADMKNNFARIQTIAHECIHSVQDRTLLIFNFIFSNINLLYFIVITLLTLFKVIEISMLYVFILTLFALIQFSIRGFLETDAMIKARYFAKEYIEKKQLISDEEEDKLIAEYDKINKLGIPFILFSLLFSAIFKILIYISVGLL